MVFLRVYIFRERGAMEKEKLDTYKNKLLKEKEALLKEIKDVEDNGLSQGQDDSSGELSYVDADGDRGTDTFERERDLSLDMNVRDILSQVNNALNRVDNGTYGTCIVCGRDIEEGRLEALPYTDLCIRDRMNLEQSA